MFDPRGLAAGTCTSPDLICSAALIVFPLTAWPGPPPVCPAGLSRPATSMSLQGKPAAAL